MVTYNIYSGSKIFRCVQTEREADSEPGSVQRWSMNLAEPPEQRPTGRSQKDRNRPIWKHFVFKEHSVENDAWADL